MNIKTLSSSLVRDEGLRLKTYRCTAGVYSLAAWRVAVAASKAAAVITLPSARYRGPFRSVLRAPHHRGHACMPTGQRMRIVCKEAGELGAGVVKG